jgi:phosphohistidine swiveling domain-containing protein
MTSRLPDQPAAPAGVKYALTVPQSVLFADLSLRGNRARAFQSAMGVKYEPRFVAVDGGAMSWDFTDSDPFVSSLVAKHRDLPGAIRSFIDATATTSRLLLRTARYLGPHEMRRPGVFNDVLADLRAYWDAYELHMTNLYTFWNIEQALTGALVEGAHSAGAQKDLDNGFVRFFKADEPNYYLDEQRRLSVLRVRFEDEREAENALPAAEAHAKQFGFLLAPFNLSEPPSGQGVLRRLQELSDSAESPEDSYARLTPPGEGLEDLPPDLAEFAQLCRQLTFWRTERLDAFALSDSLVQSLYAEAAELLDLPLTDIFLLTRDEIEAALSEGRLLTSTQEIETRKDQYCLILHDGDIGFFEPTQQGERSDATAASSGTRIVGVGACGGRVAGRVRVVHAGDKNFPALSSGEILVTEMTRIEMGALLDQADAWVTDEGGLMSHAAIYSREKNKPCVIGTGNATNLLRDGMLVEIDGAAGTVDVIEAGS